MLNYGGVDGKSTASGFKISAVESHAQRSPAPLNSEMSLTSEDMEVRIPDSVTYGPLANNDPIPHTLQSPNQTAQQERSRGPGAPNSTRSKPDAVVLEARYRECLKNHAANTGGNVTDGCGEFMPSGDAGTVEAFTCAACNCHRNFHRKELNAADTIIVHHRPPPPVPPPSLPSPSMNHHHHSVVEPVPLRSNHWTTAGMIQPVKTAFGGGSGTESSTEEVYYTTYQSQSVQPPPQYMLAKKRHRTKFMPEQKEKMLAFAEKLGWRIPREDDTEVQRFCAEVGVKRQVFKVWMHNNKSSGKKNSEENHEI